MRAGNLAFLYSQTSSILGIGKRHFATLEKFVGPLIIDLLFHLPYSCIEWQSVSTLAEAPLHTHIAIPLNIVSHQISSQKASRSGVPTRIICEDVNHQPVALVFFKTSKYILDKLPLHQKRIIFGKVTDYQNRVQIQHPTLIVEPEDFSSVPLVEPVYPLSGSLTNYVVRKAIAHILDNLPDIPEWLPSTRLQNENWPSFTQSLKLAHLPRSPLDVEPLSLHRQRLAYDEILAHQLALRTCHQQVSNKIQTVPFQSPENFLSRFQSALTFKLTMEQENAIREILKNLENLHPMQRLLQGDVGSGKTVVAFAGMVACAMQGLQACLMAPTETLASQHYKKLLPIAEAFSLKTSLLVGGQTGKQQKTARENIAAGDVSLVIGTHTLFQKKSFFKLLRLIVIDEQQRFGVHQRVQLAEKGYLADMLVLTATPIPRTLMMMHYGSLQVSLLKEKPPGRKPIQTSVLPITRMNDIERAIQNLVPQNPRIYWVCPLVEKSEKSPLTPVALRFERMLQLFGEEKVALVHGKIKTAEREQIIAAFSKGEKQILVASTVIEVGIDVPDADVIIIEHAERFGLSQLHQLRGRVGRSNKKGYCLLLYHPPLSKIAKERLAILRSSQDGFLIAEKDLQLRGAGEILGTKQSGESVFRFTMPAVHTHVLELASADAKTLQNSQTYETLLYLFGHDRAANLIKGS